MPLTKIALSLIILIGSFGCTKKQELDTTKTQEVYIDSLYTFADFESHDIADPTDIEITADNLIAIADYGTQEITLLTPEGKIVSAFGRQGRGPGDFLNIRHMYDLGDRLAVFDSHANRVTYFDYEGELSATHDLPAEAMNKDFTLVNDSLYVINREGIEGYLFQLQSLNNDSLQAFGTPIVRWKDRGTLADSYYELTSGKTPERQKNRAKLQSDGKYLYVFFEALSKMQKYDLEGNLLWHSNINLPHNKEIFESKVESAKKYSSTKRVAILDYATEFQVIQDQIYILTRRPPSGKQVLVKLNERQGIATIYHFPEGYEFCFDFDIDPRTNMLYLTSCLSGGVKRAALPSP